MKEFQKENNLRVIDKSSISQLKNKLALSDEELIITDFKLEKNKISFKTNQPNKLHLIKVSYFPNWNIQDGEGPYRITPSFMAIVPYSNNVEIDFLLNGAEEIHLPSNSMDTILITYTLCTIQDLESSLKEI